MRQAAGGKERCIRRGLGREMNADGTGGQGRESRRRCRRDLEEGRG